MLMGEHTVLLVEDEPALAELLTNILEDEGYVVATAADGHEGWLRLVETRPDLVLTDVMMPNLDGRQLCIAIKRDPDFCLTPVVLMSAAREELCRRDCECVAFLPKPFELDQVVETVEVALRSAGASPASPTP